jgi:hypothetical protein
VAPATADPSAVRIGTGWLDRSQILAAATDSGEVVVGRAFTQVRGFAGS